MSSSLVRSPRERRCLHVKRAFDALGVLACAGQTGLGKSTLINTLFASHLVDSKGRFAADEDVRQTTEIHPVSHGKSRFRLRFAARACGEPAERIRG